MFKGDSMYSILPIDATYFFNITRLHENEQKWGRPSGLPQIFFCKENGYFAVALMSSLSF